MKKQIIKFGKVLDKKDLKEINGGFRDPVFIGSGCYTTLSRCNSAMAGAIGNGVDPSIIRCVSCTTFYGSSGYEARIYA